VPEFGAAAHLGIDVGDAAAAQIGGQPFAHVDAVGKQQQQPVAQIVLAVSEGEFAQAPAEPGRRHAAAEHRRDARPLGGVEDRDRLQLLLGLVPVHAFEARRLALARVRGPVRMIEVGAPAADVRVLLGCFHDVLLLRKDALQSCAPGGTSTVLMQPSSLLEKM
jgi:hypothetical protein